MSDSKSLGWKTKKSKTNIIVGTNENPTKFDGGEVIINKKATKKNLDRLIEINNDGDGKVTTDASDGGLLQGKPHYDSNGNPTGGIPGIVAGSRKIETEGDEFVVSKEASEKHWKELSKINQSTGGVPINPPNSFDEDPEEYSEGGKILFNPNKIPNKNILKYAEMVRTKYPKVWALGGNIFGNQAYRNLKRVAERGHWEESEKWMYIKWRSYVARHIHDFRIEGVIAMLKWVDKVDRGWVYMKKIIDAEIKKRYPKKMKSGGKIGNKSFVIFFKSNFSDDIVYLTIKDSSLSLDEAIEQQKELYSWMDIKWIKGFEVKAGHEKIEFFLKNIKEKWETKPELSVKNENGRIVFYKGKDGVAFDVFILFKKVSKLNKSITLFNRAEMFHGNTQIIVDDNFNFDRNKVFELILYKMKDGGKTISQTPAPKKDRISGSKTNKPKSSSSAKSGSSIKFSKQLTDTITNKVKEHNANNPTKKVTLSVAKAVVRRGMGAYSSSHRPTISGGKPNDRTAWGLARLNAFFYKVEHGKSKSGNYTQDDDLIEELGISVQKMNNGGSLGNYAFVESTTTTGKKVFKLFDYIPTNKEVFDYFKTTYDEKGNPIIIKDSTIRIETFSGFDRDSFLEQANKVALKQFGSEIDDMDELMFSFDRYSLNVFPFEAELENDMDVVISVVDGVIFIEPTRKMNDGGNIEYQSRDLNGTMVYYKRKDGSKWDFISKNEFDQNANEMNTVKFDEGGKTMENTEKLIQTLKQNSNVQYGITSTTKDGEKYRYVSYRYKNPISPNWLVMLFQKAAAENGNWFDTKIFYKDYTIHYDRPTMKNVPNGSMGMKELEIIESKKNGGSVDENNFDFINGRVLMNGKDLGLFEFTKRGDEIEIDRLYLDKENQKGGIGRKIIQELFNKNPDIEKIVVYPLGSSVPFWLKFTENVTKDDYFEITRNSFEEGNKKYPLKNLSKLNLKQGGSVDAKDTLTVDIPLMIRLLELSREDLHSDAELHIVVERLLDLKNKEVLTMDDYAYIAEVEHKHLKPKMELGGNLEAKKLIAQAHDNLTWKKGRKEYAPTTFEIQEEIDRIIMEEQFGSNNI